jgi:hypothetical protein
MLPHFNNITAGDVTYKLGDEIKPPCDRLWVDPRGHRHLWCPVTSGTSGSSSSPRTEYRETERDTGVSFNWLPSDFISSRLIGVCRIEMAPSSQKVIFAQVHAHNAPQPFVKLLQMGQELRAEVRFRPGYAESPTVIRMPLGDARADYSIEVTGVGQLVIVLNGLRFECPVDSDWLAYPFYFKAGAYVIDNEGPDNEGGWVVYEALEVVHEAENVSP